MLTLPWKDNVKPEKMLEEELLRQLRILRDNAPETAAYQKALTTFKELNDQSMKYRKIKEFKRARIFEGFVTGALAIGTLTAEQWTPLTSKWFMSIMHPFRSRSTDNLDW